MHSHRRRPLAERRLPRVAASLVPEYARDITPESQRQKLEEIRAAQRDLMRPVGRPTKRDRRDWEKYFKD